MTKSKIKIYRLKDGSNCNYLVTDSELEFFNNICRIKFLPNLTTVNYIEVHNSISMTHEYFYSEYELFLEIKYDNSGNRYIRFEDFYIGYDRILLNSQYYMKYDNDLEHLGYIDSKRVKCWLDRMKLIMEFNPETLI